MFAAVIRFLKGHLLDTLEKRGTGIENNDIHWVLTVPAIWSDSAKQFMRESANEVIDISETHPIGLDNQKIQRKIVNIFLPINLIIYIGFSKEPCH